MKRKNIFILILFIILCTFGCYKDKTSKTEYPEMRKAYCYYSKYDSSASAGYYYVDIETKDKDYITSHYYNKYYALYAKDDFTTKILEGHCTFDGYDDNDDSFVYNKKCNYDNDHHDGFYEVKYDKDEKKDFDNKINELKNEEYVCIEIKTNDDNTITKGSWEKSYLIEDDNSRYESKYNYKFYNDGTFELTQTIDHTYSNPKNNWQTPSHEESINKGFYTFDGTIIHALTQYGHSGMITLKYIKEKDVIADYNEKTETTVTEYNRKD